MVKSAFIFIASVIGAAFASGKEIEVFFKNNNSVVPLIFASLLFIFLPIKIYLDIVNHDITDYNEYVKLKFKKHYKKVLIITTCFSLATYIAMISGGDAVFSGGGLLISLISLIVFIWDSKGIETLSFIATPFIIAGIILNCYTAIETSTFYQFKSYTYSLYNILSALPVMCSFGTYFKNKKSCIISSFISGIILSVLMVLIYLVIPDKSSPMPMLELAQTNGIGMLYKLVLFMAIVTTSVSSGFGFIQSVKISKFKALIILFVTGLAFTVLGFEKIISATTTIFGSLGTFLILHAISF